MSEAKKTEPEDAEMGLDAEDGEATVTLVSKDGQRFEVGKKDVLISNLIKTSLDSDESAAEIPVPAVEGETLKVVVDYMKHHKGTEPDLVRKPLRSKVMKEVCKDEWDAEFIDGVGADIKKLYALILAANYMDITALLHLGAAKVAAIAKGETPERIAELLNPDGNPLPAADKAEKQ